MKRFLTPRDCGAVSRKIAIPVLALALASCGGGASSQAAGTAPAGTAPAGTAPATTEAPATSAARATKIVSASSAYGRMLFDSRKQAIYLFKKDPKGKTVCYGSCAKLWPPVYTKAAPVAGTGVRKGLLGTIKRRDGRLQVTYGGHPLYFYAHEGPGKVLCHNVFNSGGLWLVVGTNGRPRPV